MAQEVNLKKGSLEKTGFVGFSWTVFFFGFFVPLIRGDFMWGGIMFLINLFTGGIGSIVMAFLYNKIYTEKLLADGWVSADESSTELLIEKGIITRESGMEEKYELLEEKEEVEEIEEIEEMDE
ncbi:HrgC protein [Fusobacterium sp. PH5-44]|uniref:HrgC protein n=1 Tax=unclassified Fusobacterium TaxID=2648384 RepID=UPI003D1D6177